MYTYPPAAPSLSGDTLAINRFLQSPALLARRLRTTMEGRFIADRILTGRYTVSGGAIQYETGETIFTAEDPRAVSPGGEYPLTTLGTGTASLAKTVKWGQDALVTDEAVKRQQMDPVNRALTKLANQNVKYVDGVAMAAVASAVTASANALADWSTATAEQILTDATLAAANIRALDQGYEPDVIVVDDINYAYAMARFGAAGFFPREGNNPITGTATFPTIGGLLWLPTTHTVAANTALVADSSQLGGMADEDLGGPGYAKVDGVGVEVKTIRDDDNDQTKLRARRVTVPVVVEPAAARKIAAL